MSNAIATSARTLTDQPVGAASPPVVLVDAGGTNIGSVRYALQRLGVIVTPHVQELGPPPHDGCR